MNTVNSKVGLRFFQSGRIWQFQVIFLTTANKMNNINSNVGLGLIQLDCGVIFGNYHCSHIFITTANEMNNRDGKASSDKRSLESNVHTVHAEMEEMLQQVNIKQANISI